MKKSNVAAITLAAAIALVPSVMFATKSEQSALRKEAKISMKKARGIALKKAPGKVESAELEREDGKLLYSFDIKTGKGISEVHVDAITGEILKVQTETAAKEAAEKKLEATDTAASKSKSSGPSAAYDAGGGASKR